MHSRQPDGAHGQERDEARLTYAGIATRGARPAPPPRPRQQRRRTRPATGWCLMIPPTRSPACPAASLTTSLCNASASQARTGTRVSSWSHPACRGVCATPRPSQRRRWRVHCVRRGWETATGHSRRHRVPQWPELGARRGGDPDAAHGGELKKYTAKSRMQHTAKSATGPGSRMPQSRPGRRNWYLRCAPGNGAGGHDRRRAGGRLCCS